MDNLIRAITNMKNSLGIKLSLKDTGITEEAFKAAMQDLPELAYDDQCTAANPRYPLISEMEQLYWKAYWGETDFDL